MRKLLTSRFTTPAGISMFLFVAQLNLWAADSDNLNNALNFESQLVDGVPIGWRGRGFDAISLDSKAPHSGEYSLVIARDASKDGTFTTITKSLPVDFRGSNVKLIGYLKTENVQGEGGLWIKEDGLNGTLAYDSTETTELLTASEWMLFEVSVPIYPGATEIIFGVMLNGTGIIRVDALEILVDNQPLAEANKRLPAPPGIENDREFLGSSGIEIEALSDLQVQNIALLGIVWGFLKYHHTNVTAGQRHWDFELFRILPHVINTSSRESAQEAIADWVDSLGPVNKCRLCIEQSVDAQLESDTDWVRSVPFLGSRLSGILSDVYKNRGSLEDSFYVYFEPDSVPIPNFSNELIYSDNGSLDSGYRLLALFRIWNIIEYWYPYRNIIDADWSSLLAGHVRTFAKANSKDKYVAAILILAAAINDSHATLIGGSDFQPPIGTCRVPLAFRYIGNEFVVSGYTNSDFGPNSGFIPGDAIKKIDGKSVSDLLRDWRNYYSYSTEYALGREISRNFGRGSCGRFSAEILRGNLQKKINSERIDSSLNTYKRLYRHDRDGSAFQILDNNVAYLKLSNIRKDAIANYFSQIQKHTNLIIDLRNYPNEFVVFDIASRLVRQATDFALFSRSDPRNPGSFEWWYTQSIEPNSQYFDGLVLVLIDELTQSQAEYTAMALSVADNSYLVGSNTAGADGDVSIVPIPGGFQLPISGIGVFYPDSSPTQRIGVRPDVYVEPTRAGLHQAKDEILEKALELAADPKLLP